jgi:mycothiol synthase
MYTHQSPSTGSLTGVARPHNHAAEATANVPSPLKGLHIRPFEDRDYERQAAIGAAISPGFDRGLPWYQHTGQHWDPGLLRMRLVAECDNLVVGWGDVAHMWWAYHPRKFVLRLNVDPIYEHRGVGSQLYAAMMKGLATWNPMLVEAETRENRTRSVKFLTRDGFAEHHRRWESCLFLSDAHVERSPTLSERVAQQGIEIVTFAEERALRGDRFMRDVFELEMRAQIGEPGFELGILTYERFVANEFDTGDTVDDGSVLAQDAHRLVGVCRLGSNPSTPGQLHVGFTGVQPEYRRRGIATVLKLRTVEFARAHGFAEIRTENDTRNVGMLHINASLGFRLESPWIIFEKQFESTDS